METWSGTKVHRHVRLVVAWVSQGTQDIHVGWPDLGMSEESSGAR